MNIVLPAIILFSVKFSFVVLIFSAINQAGLTAYTAFILCKIDRHGSRNPIQYQKVEQIYTAFHSPLYLLWGWSMHSNLLHFFTRSITVLIPALRKSRKRTFKLPVRYCNRLRVIREPDISIQMVIIKSRER